MGLIVKILIAVSLLLIVAVVIYLIDSFEWIGTTFGAQAIHNWYFIADNSKTKVIVEESLQGLLVYLMPSYFLNKLAEGVDTNLRELKTVCEL